VKLIGGLGNPGALYQLTRHNLGYCVLDYISHQNKIPFQRQTAQAFSGLGTLWDIPVVLIKPATFMNRSGEAIQAFAAYFRIATSDIIIIHDDLDLQFGQIKVKTKGGSGGHRGVESIIDVLEENTFIRIRIGIGRPPRREGESEFVLQHFAEEEQRDVQAIVMKAAQCLKTVVTEGPAAAMNQFNIKTPGIPEKL
jgi:peptidyl-tRNA hydrolase, PTH1 family